MNKPPRLCLRYDRWKITEYRDGCVYDTRLVGEAWFPMGHGPACNYEIDDHMWCATMTAPQVRTDYQETKDA